MALGVTPSAAERIQPCPGDEIVPHPDVVMDRAFTLDAPPAQVWPWLVQLGKRRAGWYLPRGVERLVPARRRGLRRIEPSLQGPAVGDIIPDWGGAGATFEIVELTPPSTVVYRSQRGTVRVSWAITVTAVGDRQARVHLRLRLGPVRRKRLAEVGGGVLDLLTVAGLKAGLRERLR